MFHRKNDVLRSEAVISIRMIRYSPNLHPSNATPLVIANESAYDNFGAGRYAITNIDRLVPLPDRMTKLSHPRIKLTLNVRSCPSLSRLGSYLKYSFFERIAIDQPSIHMHLPDGGRVDVRIDGHGRIYLNL